MNDSKINKLDNCLKNKRFLDCLKLYLQFTLSEIENSEVSLDALLFDYFSKSKCSCKKTEREIFEKHPKEFIQAVRTSQVFLEDDRFDALNSYDLGEYSTHKRVWKFLQKTDSDLWNKIEVELKNILHIPIDEILIYLTFWLEKQRYKQNTVLVLTKLASIYSFFIKFYLHSTTETLRKSEKEFSETFLKMFLDNFKKEKANPLSNILQLIYNWVTFNDDILQAYCFDLDINVKEENGIVYFNQSPLRYYNWRLDGIRYQKNRLNYYQKSTEIVTARTKQTKGTYIPHKDKATFDLNFEGAIKNQNIALILEDLQLHDFEWKGEKAGLLKTLIAISSYSNNRHNRYEEKLKKIIRKLERCLQRII